VGMFFSSLKKAYFRFVEDIYALAFVVVVGKSLGVIEMYRLLQQPGLIFAIFV